MVVAAAGLAAQGAEWRMYAQTVRIRYDSPEQAAAGQTHQKLCRRFHRAPGGPASDGARRRGRSAAP